MDDETCAAQIKRLEADRAYVLEDHRIDRRVIWGTSDFTRPYANMAEDLAEITIQPRAFEPA